MPKPDTPTPCDHGIAPGTPATLAGALAHTPPFAATFTHMQIETNHHPRSPGPGWPEDADWPPEGSRIFRKVVDYRNHPDPNPGRMHGLFTADVTYSYVLLRPCAACGDPDPFGLGGALAGDGFKRHPAPIEPNPNGEALEMIAALRAGDLAKAEAALPREDLSGLACPSCPDGGPSDKPGRFCTRCGAKKVEVG